MQNSHNAKRPYNQRHGLTKNVLLALALIGAMVWGPGGSAALAGPPESEELFTPYLVASLLPPTPGRLSDPRSEASLLAAAEASAGSTDPYLVRLGVRLIKQGAYAQAITLLEPYRFQEDFLTLHALGVAYVRTERNGEAYTTLLRAHRLNPTVAGPLLPAALACARMAKRCDEYRRLAQEYVALGGKFRRFADKIANHQPFTFILPRRS